MVANIFLALFLIISAYFAFQGARYMYIAFRAMQVLHITRVEGQGIVVNGEKVTVLTEDAFTDGFVAGAAHIWRLKGSSQVNVDKK